jgi:outer membrane protein TolC
MPAAVRALTLSEAVALSLARNERARIADESLRAADARVAKARSFLLPDLTVDGDYTRRSHETQRTVDGRVTTLQSRDGFEGRVTVEQTLFDAQALPLLGAARSARTEARWSALDEKRRLAYDTAEAFLTVLSAEHVAQAASERLDLATRNLAEIRVRYDAQLVGSNDVTRAELESATAERELVAARGVARTARLGLSHLLDVDVTDSLAVPTDLLARASAPPDSVRPPPPDFLRPDVRAAKARAATARAAAREPWMRYFPDVEVTGTALSTNESGFSGRPRDWTLGLGLSWPLFDGGVREADRGEQAALARAAELELASLERQAAMEVATARVALESEQASLARAEVAVEAARRNAAETGELYRRGLVRALEVVDANVQLFEAEVERVGAQYALAIAFLNLRLAAGLDPLEEAAP